MSDKSPKKIKIGTRTSKLALAQVDEVIELLKDGLGDREFEIVPINTTGDKNLSCNLAEIGGKGLFIKELERALVQDKIDLAVHSAKDVPPHLHEETILAAFTKRMDARDCLISKNYKTIEDLPKHALVGTSSPRRKAILLKIRPDLQIVNYRGNVTTRLNRVQEGEVDATILANCGLERLSKGNKSCPLGYDVKNFIEKEVMLPAGGQGSMAIQVKKDNVALYDFVRAANDFKSEIELRCERAFLSELGASCYTPVGVYALQEANLLTLKTIILDYDGSDVYETYSQGKFALDEAIDLGKKAAKKTKEEAKELLKKICS
ncbi:MAG: hydroxymethylbilane synthase [Rickettsiales bacterium]|nr:hydroxymethylbilane synthase [Rickettsiales bacterium]